MSRREATEAEIRTEFDQITIDLLQHYLESGVFYIGTDLLMDAKTWVTDRWTKHFEEYTLLSLARHCDNPRVDLGVVDLSHPGEIILESMAREMVKEEFRLHVSGHSEQLESVLHIQHALHRLVNDSQSEYENPSEVVEAFNEWQTEKAVSSEEADTIDTSRFNEAHVRKVKPLNWQDSVLIDALWDWLSTVNDSFPEKGRTEEVAAQ